MNGREYNPAKSQVAALYAYSANYCKHFARRAFEARISSQTGTHSERLVGFLGTGCVAHGSNVDDPRVKGLPARRGLAPTSGGYLYRSKSRGQ